MGVTQSARAWGYGLLCLALCVAGGGLLWRHPLLQPMVWLGAAALVACSAWRPVWSMGVWLALLPVSSLAIWSGWRVVDEFDIFSALILGGAYGGLACQSVLREPAPGLVSSGTQRMPPWLRMAWCMWWVAVFVATARGIADVHAHGASLIGSDWLWADYTSGANVLRVAKGAFWLLLALPLTFAVKTAGRSAEGVRAVQCGVGAGLLLVCALAVAEREAQVGLWDLGSGYRTTAWFWEMHVGGGAIDMYLAISAPFAMWALIQSQRAWQWLLSAMWLMVLVYVVVTTYSRGVIGVAALSALFMWAWCAWGVKKQGDRPVWQRWGYAVLLLMVLLEATWLLQAGQFISARFASTSVDVAHRWAHWHSLSQIPESSWAKWLGVGQGRLVAHNAGRLPDGLMPGAFVLQSEAAQPHVRLSGPQHDERLVGRFALIQRLGVGMLDGEAPLVAKLTLGAPAPTTVRFSVCQQHLLYPDACVSADIDVLAGEPRTYDVRLIDDLLDNWGAREKGLEGLAKLAVTRVAGVVDVYGWEVSSSASALVQHKADFSHGLNRWYSMSSGYFRPWHADSLYVELFVERGLLGLFAYLLLMAVFLKGAFRRVSQGEIWLVPFCVSALSMSILGGVISVIELPRLAFFGIFLTWVASLWGGRLGDKTA